MNKKYITSIGVLLLLIIGYFIVDSMLYNGAKPKAINENGFQANFFAKENANNQTTIVLLGGGHWGDYWSQEFARNDMVGLSIPYVGQQGLPQLPEAIDLAYFENAIHWLTQQKAVNKDKIVVMGASRNAELALIISATFPELISGVVAYAPSAVSWSNTVLPYNSDELKASWIYKGQDIPYIPMKKIEGGATNKIDLLTYWQKGLEKADLVNKAFIEVNKIGGPILLFSGKDDKVWASAQMANMIEKRLNDFKFTHAFQNIQYPNAGHLISGNPNDKSTSRTGTLTIDGKKYEYQFGGNNEGDYEAKQDAKTKLLTFLKAI